MSPQPRPSQPTPLPPPSQPTPQPSQPPQPPQLPSSFPAGPLPSRQEYFARWQVLHNAATVDPQAKSNALLRWFLTIVYWLARPFARAGVSPNVITALGLLQGAAALGAAQRWPGLAGGIILASSFTDGIDGCVAALTDRSTKVGALFDSIADRATEWCFVGCVVMAGAVPWLGVAAGAAIMFFEYTRARLLALGVHDVGLVTVGERPTRVIACTVGCAGAAFSTAELIPAVSLAAVTATSVVALLQLAVWARPRLR